MVNSPAQSHLRRVLRYFSYAVAALAVLVVAAAVVLPVFIDSPVVRAEIQRKLSEAVSGEVAWDDLALRILPTPRGVLGKARIEIPGIARLRAEQIETRLAFWPLLRGQAEITAVSIMRPEIRIDIADRAGKEDVAGGPDLLAVYRSAMAPIVAGIRRFAPDAVISVEDAVVSVRAPAMPPLELRDLSVHVQSDSDGVKLASTSASNYWGGLTLSAHVEFSTLAARATLDATEIRPQAWLDRYLGELPMRIAIPAAGLRAQVSIGANTPLACDFDLTAVAVDVSRAGEIVRVADVGLKGQLTADAQALALGLDEARLGASRLQGGKLNYEPTSRALSGSTGFDVDLAQGMDATRRLLPERAGAVLARFQPASGRAQGDVKLTFAPSGWRVGVNVVKSGAAIEVGDLPGPLRLAGASIEIDADRLTIARAALSMLDAQALVSATVSDYRTERLQVTASVSEGVLHDELLAWAQKFASLPPHLELKAPVFVVAQRIAWSPKRTLDVAATARFGGGPEVAVELGWTPDALDLRRATIKDERSEATIALHKQGGLLEGRFTGTLHGASIAALLRNARVLPGSASGDLRFIYDRAKPGRTRATGHLKGAALDLAWLLRRPVKIDRIDLVTDETALRIREAAVDWAGQRATISGVITRSATGPVIDARLDSAGINFDALFPPAEPTAAPMPPEPGAARADAPSQLWPLPLTGRVAVRSEFIQRGRYTVAPLAATLVLERQHARLNLTQAQLCGLSLPSSIEAAPAGFSAAVRITAQNQSFEQTAQCLTGNDVQITGLLTLNADITTRGKPAELMQNLSGTVHAELKDGTVLKFALVDNILSSQSVADQLEEDDAKRGDAGVSFRMISLVGHFEADRFIVEESAFRGSTVGLVANGWVSVSDYQSRLAVLVAPFSRLDEAVRKVPIVGYVVGGVLTSIPVGVSGDIRDPLVVPLGPGAVTSELIGIFERTLKLPGRLVDRPAGSEEQAPAPAGESTAD